MEALRTGSRKLWANQAARAVPADVAASDSQGAVAAYRLADEPGPSFVRVWLQGRLRMHEDGAQLAVEDDSGWIRIEIAPVLAADTAFKMPGCDSLVSVIGKLHSDPQGNKVIIVKCMVYGEDEAEDRIALWPLELEALRRLPPLPFGP
eukprot:tig00021035_g17245.t1